MEKVVTDNCLWVMYMSRKACVNFIIQAAPDRGQSSWGQHASSRPQMGPLLAPWTLLSGVLCTKQNILKSHSTKITFHTLRLGQHDCHFVVNIFKQIFLNENCCILIKISLKFVDKGIINNRPALVQIMAWCQTAHYLNQWWPSWLKHIHVSLSLDR